MEGFHTEEQALQTAQQQLPHAQQAQQVAQATQAQQVIQIPSQQQGESSWKSYAIVSFLPEITQRYFILNSSPAAGHSSGL